MSQSVPRFTASAITCFLFCFPKQNVTIKHVCFLVRLRPYCQISSSEFCVREWFCHLGFSGTVSGLQATGRGRSTIPESLGPVCVLQPGQYEPNEALLTDSPFSQLNDSFCPFYLACHWQTVDTGNASDSTAYCSLIGWTSSQGSETALL